MVESEAQTSPADLPMVPWETIGDTEVSARETGVAEGEFGAALDLAAPAVCSTPARGQPGPVAPRIHEAQAARNGGWTLSLLCAGLGLIACCVLIPQADANRRLAYEHLSLQADLDMLQRQVAVNDEFLKKVCTDPTLAQRLAERQMKVIPQGSRVLPLDQDQQAGAMSPYQLVSVAPPKPLPPYKPVGGTIANLCYDVHTRLYLIGAALGLVAVGLVLDLGARPEG